MPDGAPGIGEVVARDGAAAGAVRLTLALLPSMFERGDGHVVQVSTLGTLFHPPRFSASLAAKAALEEYSRVLATQVESRGVTVSVSTCRWCAPP